MKTKTRFQKLTAWFITLAMLMTFIPGFTLGVSAAEDTHTHPICCDNDCADHASQAWTAWNESSSLPTASGYYYLTTNVKLTAMWTPQDDTYLCLNGKVIEGNGSESVIFVNESFTLTDCDSQATHKFSVDEDTGLWTLDEENGTKTVTGGVITGGNTSEYGGGVFVNEFGTFNMYGGAISGNVAQGTGGGVCVFIGTFTMTGGTISDNTANQCGGVHDQGTFIMSGGTISGNTAIYAVGGVGVIDGTFTMTGGEISGNTALDFVGGVGFLGGTFNLSGTPVIKDNSVSNNNSVDNIFIGWGLSITVNDALTDGANIGVTMERTTGTFAQPDGTNITSLADYKNYFSSDASGYEVAVNGNNLDLVAPTYTVAIADTTNGTVTADKTTAAEGDTVTLTVTPVEGYELDTLTVKDADDNDVTVTDNTFTMPASNVTVSATFKAVEYAASVTTSAGITTNYTKFDDALSAAQAASGSTLTLLKDYNNSFTISGGNFTIDLNGKNIQRDASGTCTVVIENAAEITIKDSGENGKIISGQNISLKNDGTLTIVGGIFESKGAGVENNGTLLFSGGTITSTGSSPGLQNEGTATITGGMVAGVWNDDALIIKNDAVLSGGEADIVYYSGTVDLSEWNNASGATIHNGQGHFTVSDSTIKLPAGLSLLDKDGGAQTELKFGHIYTVGVEIPTYTVAIADTTNGTVTADKENAAEGDTVTLTVTPATGYELDTLTVKDADNGNVTVTDNTFTMPAKNVTVSATFVEKIPVIESLTFNSDSEAYDAATQTFYYDAEHTLELTVTGENLLNRTLGIGFANSEGVILFTRITLEHDTTDTITVDKELLDAVLYSFVQYEDKADIVGVLAMLDMDVPDTWVSLSLNVVPRTYTVALPTVTDGTVEADVSEAAEGDTVTITVTPNTGMKVDTITVRDKDGNPVEITNNGNGNYTYTQPDSDVTVTVTFKAVIPAICTVTFDANGGTDAPTYATTGADGKLTELPAPVREGYIFNGWFDAAEGGNAVTLDTIFTENTTIYAHWTLKKYEIYVGGEQVTAENAADVLSDGTVSYNAKTNTLTLNNANLTSGTNLSSINVATLLSKDDLNIELKGTNKITAPDMTGVSNGIFVGSDLTIFGSGSLTVIGGNVSGVAEVGTGYFASNGIVVGGLLTIRTAEVNAIGGTVSVTGDTIVESSDDICQAASNGILSYSGLVLEDGAKINATGGNVSINTANDDVAVSRGIYVYYGDTVIHDAVLNAAGGKATGGENAYSYGISTVYAGVKVCDSDAKVTLTSGDTEGTETSSSNGICVYGGDLDIQAGSVSVTSGKRNEDAIGDNAAVYVEGHTDESDGLQGGNLSLASGMKISSPANGTVKKIDDTYYTVVDNNGNIATNVEIEAEKKSYSGGSSSTTTTTTKNDDGSTTKTTTNKITGTTTETTTYPDGSTTKVETKKDGTVTTTEKDKDGNTTTTALNPDGSSTTTEKNKDGSETVVEKDTEGTTTTTKKDSEGNKTVTTEEADGTTTTEETKKDGTTVKTETTANGETTAEVEAKGETEVVIPVPDADEVTKVVVTDKDGNETEVEFEVKDGGIAISVLGNSTVSVQTGHICYAKDFTDVDLDAWYHLNVDYVLENGLFKGTTETTFAPNDNLTRAMLVTVLYRAEGEPGANRSIPFADVDMGSYYANAVIWAQQNGIVKGVSETEFAPNDNITREQIAAILYRYAIYKGMDAVNLSENLSFTDADEISEYAISALNWAVGTGLIKGYEDNTVRPLNNATRAETAALLQRFIEAN